MASDSRVVILGLCLCSLLLPVARSQQNPSSSQERTAIVQPSETITEKVDASTRLVLPAATREQIDHSPVAVLLPSGLADMGKFNVDFGDNFYTATFIQAGHSISILGTRVTYRYPSQKALPGADRAAIKVRDVTGFASVSEGIWNISWQQHGASYILSLECNKPDEAMCRNSDFILSVGNNLRFVGGGIVPPKPLPAAPASHYLALLPTGFTYNPPGTLKPNSGTGVSDNTIYAPGIRFPVQDQPAYANSQVYNPGGAQGGGGSQCSGSNYSYPWWDNFCETRDAQTPMCPSGKGHQGQDIRPSKCLNDTYYVVAAAAGKVTNIGSYSVFITASDGTQYRYLHMSSVMVTQSKAVSRGDQIGKVSNVFTAPTTYHLHFEILQNVQGHGIVHVPPYASLVEAYKVL
jgi:murein DD-endopeptidase MepM/ murein hydrolase activator NlpD